MKTIIQYCIQTQDKKSRFGWEFYSKDKTEALQKFEALKKDKTLQVRLFVERIVIQTFETKENQNLTDK